MPDLAEADVVAVAVPPDDEVVRGREVLPHASDDLGDGEVPDRAEGARMRAENATVPRVPVFELEDGGRGQMVHVERDHGYALSIATGS